jgi:uncharacterized protein (DUF362 family)
MSGMSRRRWLGVAAGAAGAATLGAGGRLLWQRQERFQRAATFIARAGAYDGTLVETVLRGLRELGVGEPEVAGRRVLLKPNLVEPSTAAPHINTHPALVRAVAEVFRRLGAREVAVGEGPGHVRDGRLVLDESGLGRVLSEDRLAYHDLNSDEIYSVGNPDGFSRLDALCLPATLRRYDLLVSLPKLKTHHWAGLTCALKNLFGVMPGIVYGWPKNVLHAAGLQPAILDIARAVRPALAIVDGIVGMEGDGPIMGRPRRSGLLVMGRNLVAVDATAARLIGMEPARLDYLRVASGRMGPIRAEHIEQRGERLDGLAQRYELPPRPERFAG